MYLEIFLADFAVFRVFLGISRDFAGPRPREISEALLKELNHIASVHIAYFFFILNSKDSRLTHKIT